MAEVIACIVVVIIQYAVYRDCKRIEAKKREDRYKHM